MRHTGEYWEIVFGHTNAKGCTVSDLKGKIRSIASVIVLGIEHTVKLAVILGRYESYRTLRRMISRDNNRSSASERVEDIELSKATGFNSMHGILVSSVDASEVAVFDFTDEVFKVGSACSSAASVQDCWADFGIERVKGCLK
jgi:hypothetical protein